MKRNSLAKQTAIALPVIGGIIAGAVLFSSFGFYMAMLTGVSLRTTSLPAPNINTSTYENTFGAFRVALPANHIATVTENCEGGCAQTVTLYSQSTDGAYKPADITIHVQNTTVTTIDAWQNNFFEGTNQSTLAHADTQTIGNLTATKYVQPGLFNTTHYLFIQNGFAYAISVGENASAAIANSILSSFALTQ